MHADHSTLQIIAHLMIAFLFVFRAIHAMPTFAHHADRFRERGVPFPGLVLAGGFATMLTGGGMHSGPQDFRISGTRSKPGTLHGRPGFLD